MRLPRTMTWRDLCTCGLMFLVVCLLAFYRPAVHHGELYHDVRHKSDTVKVRSLSENVTFIFEKALQVIGSEDRTIALVYVDAAYVDMAANFYEFSILRLRLNNTLFIAPSRTTCGKLVELGAHCCACANDSEVRSAHEQSAIFGSRDFWKKVGVRIKFLYEALRLNYTVFHVDADVLFFKNPWREFTCVECDLEILTEVLPNSSANVGTMLIRPTPASLRLFKTLEQTMRKHPLTKLQREFNAVLAADRRVRYRFLNPHRFVCGKEYFGSVRVMYPYGKQCLGCVLVHNNFIYTKEAKVYRFRENLLWLYDDDGYYSSSKFRYLQYDNPPDGILRHHTNSTDLQLRALRNALAIGQVLDRIVILPPFYCPHTPHRRCSLLHLVGVLPFERVFEHKYRESTFLQNPKTPLWLSSSMSPKSMINQKSDCDDTVKVICFSPRSPDGATSAEIQDYFSKLGHYPVLRLGRLENGFSNFSDEKSAQKFNDDIARAFFEDDAVQERTGIAFRN